MGYSKKLCNVLGGYKCIIASLPLFVYTQLAQSLQIEAYDFIKNAQHQKGAVHKYVIFLLFCCENVTKHPLFKECFKLFS